MDSCFILLIVAVQYTPFASPKQNAEKWYASFLFLGVMTIVFRDSPVSMRIKDLLLFYSVKKFYTYKLLHFHHHFE